VSGRLRKDTEDLAHELDAVESHVQYLRKIIQAQQSFARGGGEAVNVRELLETALTLKGQELRGARISRDLSEDLPEVWTNRHKLLQIVVNFIGHAGDAITANEPAQRRIAIRAQLTGCWLEIAVEDSGVGAAADLPERAWEFGATPHTHHGHGFGLRRAAVAAREFTTKEDGHGFGLHSAALAAQQLGGSVAASSAGPGQGACFSVRIPARTVHGASAGAVV
jgi:two-component system, NtrC family, sensor kinase